MNKVFVVYGSRHGGTQGIAERIGEVLRSEGLDAVVAAASQVRDPRAADAFVIGSGVYMGSWLKEPVEFIERNKEVILGRPVWLFSSGPLPSASTKDPEDPITSALGPAEGPGSGGRKKIADLSEAIQSRDHRVFLGAFDPTDPPRAMSERLARMLPAVKKVLPPGDFRDWESIEAWAREIAATLSVARGVA